VSVIFLIFLFSKKSHSENRVFFLKMEEYIFLFLSFHKLSYIILKANSLIEYSQSFMEISELVLLLTKYFILVNFNHKVAAIIKDMNIYFRRGSKNINMKHIQNIHRKCLLQLTFWTDAKGLGNK
jgi:hypothetical protein